MHNSLYKTYYFFYKEVQKNSMKHYLNTDDIKLLNIIKINGRLYKITYMSCIGDVVLSFKAVNIHDKKDCLKLKKATN